MNSFKIGDRVKVFRGATEQEEVDCHCKWVSCDMDNAINRTGKISRVTRRGNIGIRFDDASNNINIYSYPLPTVMLVDRQLLFNFMYEED